MKMLSWYTAKDTYGRGRQVSEAPTGLFHEEVDLFAGLLLLERNDDYPLSIFISVLLKA